MYINWSERKINKVQLIPNILIQINTASSFADSHQFTTKNLDIVKMNYLYISSTLSFVNDTHEKYFRKNVTIMTYDLIPYKCKISSNGI